jgi:O-antigen/teichoic acid export membrane protein
MGIVKKQAYKNTFISYLGIVIGYANLLLYNAYFTLEQYGLYQLLLSLSILYSLIASMGIPGIIIKYFPVYRSEDKNHNGFTHWTALFALMGFAGFTILFIFLRPVIVSSYIKNSPLFIRYYFYLVPLTFFLIFFNFLEAFGKVIFQTVFSAFLRDVILRILTTVTIVLMGFGYLNFQQFVILYVASNGIICIILLLRLAASKQFSLMLPSAGMSAINKRDVANYGFFVLLTSAVSVLIQKVDTVMLSSLSGLEVNGVYNYYFSIAMVIIVPAQALGRTTYQIVANAWQSKDMAAISSVYKKTSTVQMVVSSLLFIGLIINKENLLTIVHKQPFRDHFNILIVIGLGLLVDVTGGLNGYIISTSHKYKLITLWVAIASVVSIGLNYLLIPIYGGLGAALAYLITFTAYNLCTWYYLKTRFNMQPFNTKHLLVILIAAVSFAIGNYFWRMPNTYLDIMVRSLVTTVVYAVLTYFFKISEDINEKVQSTFNNLKLS